MFLNEKDPEHNPPGKYLVIRLKNIALWLLILSALLKLKGVFVLALLLAVFLGVYYTYLLITKQSYLQFLKNKKQINNQKVAQYQK